MGSGQCKFDKFTNRLLFPNFFELMIKHTVLNGMCVQSTWNPSKWCSQS
jgi:hypothetical protein